MSLRAQAAADNHDILNDDGDDITLIASDDTEYDVKGQVIRIDVDVDPDTGVEFYQPKTAVSISYDDLPAEITVEDWRVSTTDANGDTITGIVAEVRYDRTLGFVTLILEVFS